MDYYKETPPLEFISDVYDVMKGGDCLSPEKLNADVVDMLGKYLSAQHGVHVDGAARCPNCKSKWDKFFCAECGYCKPPRQ